ncbi:MAG: alpha/beta hydrolase [Alistipes sp.]|nr:alpha/beta hydrolase [Alistipes sp.]
MRKLITLIITIACTLSVSAQKTISFEGADEVVRLWDNSTAKHSNHETRDEKWHKENVSYCQTSSCELYIFKAAADKNTGVAIAMFPGGSYRNGNLSVSLAKWYASQGITAALVKYRLPNYGHNKATLEDAEGAVRYLRTRTDLGINPAKVGVQGSSAGGHLASWVSNAMSDGEKPAFTILHYPWIDLAKSRSSAEASALRQLLGKRYTFNDALSLSTYTMVTSTTPPTLLFLCHDDSIVLSTNSTKYYKALIQHGVKASLHIYPSGGHSLNKHTNEYQPETIHWLQRVKIIEKR